MIQSLLLSLLHLLTLIALIRIFLPKSYVVLNPYGAGVDTLFSRLLGTLHTAIPVGTKPLCALLILMAISARAALLYSSGAADFQAGLFVTAHFNPGNFPGWFAFAALDFFAFWFTLQVSVLLLRLWHFLRPLPGFAGDLLRLGTHPLSLLPLRAQVPLLIAAAVLLVMLPLRAAASAEFTVLPIFTELIQETLLPGRPAPQLPLSAAQLCVAAFSFLPLLISAIQSFLVLVLIIRLVSGFFKSKSVYFLTGELLTLFCGRLPRIALGSFDLTPLLAFFVLNIIVNLFVLFFGVLLYVV